MSSVKGPLIRLMTLNPQHLNPKPNIDSKSYGHINPVGQYLESQGDLVSRLIMGINRVTKWVMGVIKLLTKSHQSTLNPKP